MRDDHDLLAEYVLTHSDAAFAELVQRHLNLVHSAAMRRVGGDPHRAADVCQAVFTALARNARRLRDHPALGAWLHLSTRNAALNLLRGERRRDHHHETYQAMADFSPETETLDWSAAAPVLDASLDALHDRDRRAVVLRFFENRSYAQIGATLGVGEDAARKQVARSLEKLNAILSRRGVTTSAAALGAAMSAHAVTLAPAGLATQVSTAAAAAGAASAGVFATMLATSPAKIAFVAVLAAGGAGAWFYTRSPTSGSVVPGAAAPATATVPAVTPPANPAAALAATAAHASPPASGSELDRALGEALTYDLGKTVPRDAERAHKAYERAAALGSAAAEFRLGYFYEIGEGVPQSYTDARRHYQRAIELGLPAAGLRLGLLDLEGWGAPRDVAEAARHIRAAADSGDRAAERILAGMYFAGIGVERDLSQALVLEERAAVADEPAAETMIGAVLGLLDRANTTAARQWFQLSAEQGYTHAMLGMASTFLRAEGTSDDFEKGRRWLQLAAENDDSAAAFHLAGLLLLNKEMAAEPNSAADARRWLEKSRDLGEPRAGEVLELGKEMPLAAAMRQVTTLPLEQRYVQRSNGAGADKPDAHGFVRPRPIKVVQPVYPSALRLVNTPGEAMVIAEVDTTGRVASVKLKSATHPAFGDAALRAVRAWRFAAATMKGRAVPCTVGIPVSFTMSDVSTPQAGIRCEISSIGDTGVRTSVLEIKLALKAATPIKGRAWRAIVTAAKDDTGLDVKPSSAPHFYSTTVGGGSSSVMTVADVPALGIYPDQPATAAKSLRVLEGRVELVVPDFDADSKLTVASIRSKLGVPIEGPGLAENKIVVVVYDQATANRFKNEPFGRGGPQDYDSGPMFSTWPGSTYLAGLPPARVAQMRRPASMSARQWAVGISDPEGRLIGVEFLTNDGQPLYYNHNGSYHADGMEGYPERRLDVFDLPNSLPPDFQMVCWIATKQSILTVPFHFENVALPQRRLPPSAPLVIPPPPAAPSTPDEK